MGTSKAPSYAQVMLGEQPAVVISQDTCPMDSGYKQYLRAIIDEKHVRKEPRVVTSALLACHCRECEKHMCRYISSLNKIWPMVVKSLKRTTSPIPSRTFGAKPSLDGFNGYTKFNPDWSKWEEFWDTQIDRW